MVTVMVLSLHLPPSVASALPSSGSLSDAARLVAAVAFAPAAGQAGAFLPDRKPDGAALSRPGPSGSPVPCDGDPGGIRGAAVQDVTAAPRAAMSVRNMPSGQSMRSTAL